jgi:hypothetical protein
MWQEGQGCRLRSQHWLQLGIRLPHEVLRVIFVFLQTFDINCMPLLVNLINFNLRDLALVFFKYGGHSRCCRK